MQIVDGPVGYFITWTVYGTFLQGDPRWWRKRNEGNQPPQPQLAKWHSRRLKHDIILLSPADRAVVESKITEHCDHRNWKLWIANSRSNHVHVVVTASGYGGAKVRDQLKANCTGGLREHDRKFVGRPVWTTKGDVEHLDTEDELQLAILYAGEAQNRMDRGK